MEILGDSFVIDFESIAKDPNVGKTAEQLRLEFQENPTRFIDQYIESFTEFFRPVDLDIINDPMKEEIFGCDKQQAFQMENDEDGVLAVFNNKTLVFDDLIQMTQSSESGKELTGSENVFDLTLSSCEFIFENIECIDITGNGIIKLILGLEEVMKLTGENNRLVIIGDDGDEVVTKGNWLPQGMVSIDGYHYVQYVHESDDEVAILLIHSNVVQTDTYL